MFNTHLEILLKFKYMIFNFKMFSLWLILLNTYWCLLLQEGIRYIQSFGIILWVIFTSFLYIPIKSSQTLNIHCSYYHKLKYWCQILPKFIQNAKANWQFLNKSLDLFDQSFYPLESFRHSNCHKKIKRPFPNVWEQ